jgi:DNA-binding NarL/FixJ family response regulator
LRAAQGDIGVAASMIQRVVAESTDPTTRSRVLPAFVDIMLDAGDVQAARAGANELHSLSREITSQFIRAESALATSAVELAEGQPAEALPLLRQAFESFVDLDVGPRAIRARQLIATACDALGDTQTAEMERRSADAALDAFRASPGRIAARPPASPDGLTARELEVLRAVAAGKTNKAIGEELYISEKTVASHVSHIFTKVNVTSRAAATAYAYDNDLV